MDPRARQLPARGEDGGLTAGKPNHLITSRSVYLQQHARNPVDWHPWGAEAIAAARARNVPMFVSIGYSTCYWCHVMERESFESADAAAVLNRVCVPVKVDREERPDIDEVMMTACQVFTQLTEGRASGGWPLNVLLDPVSLQPFFCGTYFPPQPAHGRPSFTQLLLAIEKAWHEDADGLRKQAAQIARHVSAQLGGIADQAAAGAPAPAPIGTDDQVAQVVDTLMRAYDPTNGGFGGAPKFPTPSYPTFLLATRGDVPSIESALRYSLDRMAVGGLFDQVGGGFHRYCVDATWTVPHFEKMLYDNAQLALVYTHAATRWGDAFYAGVARRTLDYVLREMTGPDGQFLSAQDAEVGAREGGNYVWTEAEVRTALAAGALASDEIDLAVRAYGLDRGPNFQDPHHPGAEPSNVLRLSARPSAVAKSLGVDAGALDGTLARANSVLLASRATRPQPITDDKTIAAWSGMMIEAMAECGEPYARAADRAADFVLTRMRGPDGGLLRVWRGGEAAVPAYLEDYACMANGLIALGRESDAVELLTVAHARFADPARGAWFDVSIGQNELWVRSRNLDDGAMPSGTSSVLRALVALSGTSEVCRAWATELIESVSDVVREQPVSASGIVLAAWKLRAGGVGGAARAGIGARAKAGAHPSVPAPSVPAPSVPAPSPVTFTAQRASDGLAAELTMVVAAGHHVSAGTDFEIAGSVISVTPLDAPTEAGWEGRVRFALALALKDAEPATIAVRWQVCTDRECRPPQVTNVSIEGSQSARA